MKTELLLTLSPFILYLYVSLYMFLSQKTIIPHALPPSVTHSISPQLPIYLSASRWTSIYQKTPVFFLTRRLRLPASLAAHRSIRSIVRPTMGSPRFRETSAIFAGFSKCVTACGEPFTEKRERKATDELRPHDRRRSRYE